MTTKRSLPSIHAARDPDGPPDGRVLDFTERNFVEQALRRSEERFRSLAMLSSDWYWEQDEQFRFTVFSGNEQASPWLQSHEFAVGKCRWELAGHHPLVGTWEQHRAVLEARQPFRDFEFSRPGEDGRRYISTSGEPVFEAGVFVGYRGTGRDIAQRKLAEQRLRNTQALLHLAAQVGRLGAWAYEIGQPHVTWSEEVCAIHDVKPGFRPAPEEALAFFVPRHQDTMRRIISACLRDGSPFDVESEIVSAKGRQVWVRVIAEAEWDAQGRVRRIQGACQDISEGKRAADDARLMAQQLTTTLESLTDAFFTFDRDWRITYLNGQGERLVRRPRGELLGKVVWTEFPEAVGTAFQGHFERAMAEGVPVQAEDYYAPFDAWLQVKAYPSRQGLAVYVKDVTERIAHQREILRLNAELEGRVRQRTAQLEAANKELEAFAYSIAHDLRAPLSSIDGFSQMLESSTGDKLVERGRHYLSRIRAGVRQMGELTDGLLSLANLSRESLLHEDVDLAAIARAEVASCRERSPARAADVEIAASLPARGDPRLLSQVIANLVGNAWKFTARTERARIEIGSAASPAGPVYFVRDNGAGFDMAYASRMFEAFQRLHSPGEFEGTGIGLAIVHKIVARHNGRVWAEAAPQRGACFYFTLGHAAG